MKKILIITGGVLPLPAIKGGGAETVCTHFLNENEKKNVFLIDVISCPGAEKEQKNYRNASFVVFNRNEKKDKLAYRINKMITLVNYVIPIFPFFRILDSFDQQVCVYVKKKSYDVILVENRWTVLVGLKKQPKVVYHAHYDDVNLDSAKWIQRRFKKLYKYVNTNISVSDFLSRRIGGVIHDTRLIAIHNCVDYSQYSAYIDPVLIELAKDKYNIPKSSFVYMYAGRIVDEKGVLELIKAFKMLSVDACLVIVGGIGNSENKSNSYLELLKKEASFSNNPIIFTGYIEQKQMPVMWKLCNVAVVPTIRVEEAAGLVVIEAMAVGKPVIISDSGAMTEYITGKCGIVVKRDNNFVNSLSIKMLELYKNPDICAQMGNNGRERAKLFDKTEFFNEMAEILLETC